MGAFYKILLVGAIFALISGILYGPFVASQYKSYDGEEECEIVDIDTRISKKEKRSSIEYKYTYEYTVDDTLYVKTSKWVEKKYHVGDFGLCKYNTSAPDDSMLECEKDSALKFSISLTIILLMFAGVQVVAVRHRT